MTLGKTPAQEVGYVFQCRLLQESFTQQDAGDVALFSLCGGRLNVQVAWGLADMTDYWPPGQSLEDDLPVGALRGRAKRSARLAAFARDITGNPFRHVALDPSWLTSDVMALADGIYQERAFDRLPVLADALMDGGCGQDDILSHCRSDGPHVRGCWVVELVLGRSIPAGAGDLRLVGLTAGFEGRVWTFSDPFEVGRRGGRFLAD